MEKMGKKLDVLSASEIGQYHYCPVAWYLQRCGYEPNSPHLKKGLEKHEMQGIIIEKTKKYEKKSRKFATIGYVLLAISFVIILFEVII